MRHLQKWQRSGPGNFLERAAGKIQPFIEKARNLLAGKSRLRRGRGPFTGVCQGIGEYFEINPVWVRLAFGVAAVINWWALVVYGALAFFLPQKKAGDELWEEAMEGEEWEDEPAVVDLRICEHCNTAVKPHARYCHHCGAQLEPAAKLPFD